MTTEEDNGHESFLDAVESNSMATVTSSLQADRTRANSGMDGGSRPLHRVKTSEMVELLIKYGADVNAKGIDDMTPLHVAARDGKIDVIPSLIASGANVNAVDNNGRSVLSYAAQEQYEGKSTAKVLLDASAYYDLTSAASLGDLNEVKKIIANNKQVTRNIASIGALLSGILFNSNCEEPNRQEILKLIVGNGINISKEEAIQFVKAAEDQGDTDLADILRHLSS